MKSATKNVLALTAPVAPGPPPAPGRDAALRVLGAILSAPRSPQPVPVISAVAMVIGDGVAARPRQRTPAPIRQMKDDGIIGVT